MLLILQKSSPYECSVLLLQLVLLIHEYLPFKQKKQIVFLF